MQNNAYNAYKNNSVLYASKEQLLLILVENAVKYTKIGRQAMIDKKFEKSNMSLQKVQDIFIELMSSLDQNAGKWAKDLYKIYDFIVDKLAQANLKKDIKIIDEILPLIIEIKETWNEAYKLSKR